jgi:hypothetical protein
MSFIKVPGQVYTWIPDGPTDPGYGHPSWSPADPGYGLGAGNRPDAGLPWAPAYPSHGLPWAPGHPSTGLPPVHVGGKPPGRPILPPSVDNGLPPVNHPWWGGGGRWEILDPGFGKPPLLGFFPVDPGFGIPESPPPVVGGGPSTPPPVVSGGPIVPDGGGGNWVPTDPNYGIEECPGGRPKPPIWAWIPTPPDLTKPVPLPTPK